MLAMRMFSSSNASGDFYYYKGGADKCICVAQAHRPGRIMASPLGHLTGQVASIQEVGRVAELPPMWVLVSDFANQDLSEMNLR